MTRSGSPQTARLRAWKTGSPDGGTWRIAAAPLLIHGCKLPDHEVRNLLELDVRLNAQGLENWLNHAGESR